jgi:hypothetical protein
MHLARVLETGVERPGLVEDVDVAGGTFGSVPGFEGQGWVADEEDGPEGFDEGVGEDCWICLFCVVRESEEGLLLVDRGEWRTTHGHAPHALRESRRLPCVECVFFEEESLVLFS